MAAASAAAGSLSLHNSRGAGAIFSVDGLAPGHSTAGEVTITNSGSLGGALALTAGDRSETPGQGGGLLSQRLVLVVLDLTGPSTVYTGPLAALGTRDLGTIGSGEARRFRFTATLPDGGEPPSATAGDNVYQGASMTTSYVWSAGASETSDPTDPKLVPRVRLIRRQPPLRRRRLVLYARCSEPCTLTARARLPGRGGRSLLSHIAT